jgi:hypothetical protein
VPTNEAAPAGWATPTGRGGAGWRGDAGREERHRQGGAASGRGVTPTGRGGAAK